MIILGLLFFIFIMVIAVCLSGLICWGVVNGILFLLGMGTTFTFLQGIILALIIWGIKTLIKGVINIKIEK